MKKQIYLLIIYFFYFQSTNVFSQQINNSLKIETINIKNILKEFPQKKEDFIGVVCVSASNLKNLEKGKFILMDALCDECTYIKINGKIEIFKSSQESIKNKNVYFNKDYIIESNYISFNKKLQYSKEIITIYTIDRTKLLTIDCVTRCLD